MPPIRKINATQIQRSACDSCRIHKIRCVREAREDFCTRCKRLELDCTTSVRSRMGRPPQHGNHKHAEDNSRTPSSLEDDLATQLLGTYRGDEDEISHRSLFEPRVEDDCRSASSDDCAMQGANEGTTPLPSITPDTDWSWSSLGVRDMEEHTDLIIDDPFLHKTAADASINARQKEMQTHYESAAHDVTFCSSTKWSALSPVARPDNTVERLSKLLQNVSKLLQCLQEDRVQELNSHHIHGSSFIDHSQEFASLLSEIISDMQNGQNFQTQGHIAAVSERPTSMSLSTAETRPSSSMFSAIHKAAPNSDIVSTMLVVSCYTQLIRIYDTIIEWIMSKLLNESQDFCLLDGMEPKAFPLTSSTGRIVIFMQMASHVLCHIESCLGLTSDYRVIKSVLTPSDASPKSNWATMYEKLDLEDNSRYRKRIKKHIKNIKQILETRPLF